jgi:hypothetical protein
MKQTVWDTLPHNTTIILPFFFITRCLGSKSLLASHSWWYFVPETLFDSKDPIIVSETKSTTQMGLHLTLVTHTFIVSLQV